MPVFIFLHVNNFDPLAGWLIIAYVLFAVAAIFPQIFTGPWLKKVAAAANASPDDRPSDELRELLTSQPPVTRVGLAGHRGAHRRHGPQAAAG